MTGRVIYRTAEEFNTAMDKAADAIRVARGGTSEVVGQVVWWTLIATLAFIYGSNWVFGWNVRQFVPWFDPAKPVWVIVVGMIVIHHAWARNQHARILRNRLCLACGRSLAHESVDDAGDGTCPQCAREFNLGEYRRPIENRGSEFAGYLDKEHFDKAMFAAAERLKKTRVSGFEADLMGWTWLALGIFFGLGLLGWDVLEFLPTRVPGYGVAFVLLLIWGAWYTARVKRLRPAIVERRLCMNCGYSLLHTPIEDTGLGRCPECGESFTPGQYEAPR